MKRERRNPLEKALWVINALMDAPESESGVRDLAKLCGLSPSTVHRTLDMLEDEGLVRQDRSRGRYQLGLEFFRLGWRAISTFPLSRLALPILRELVDTCDETAVLYLYDPVRMAIMPVAVVETRKPVRQVVKVGSWGQVYAGASGLGVMAFLPEAEQQEIISRTGLQRVTDRTITDPGRLKEFIEQIRRQGYASTRGQRTPGAVGISAPIWGPDGRVLGDLVLTAPEQRFDPTVERELIDLVVVYARRITERLGGRMPPSELGDSRDKQAGSLAGHEQG